MENPPKMRYLPYTLTQVIHTYLTLMMLVLVCLLTSAIFTIMAPSARLIGTKPWQVQIPLINETVVILSTQ